MGQCDGIYMPEARLGGEGGVYVVLTEVVEGSGEM